MPAAPAPALAMVLVHGPGVRQVLVSLSGSTQPAVVVIPESRGGQVGCLCDLLAESLSRFITWQQQLLV